MKYPFTPLSAHVPLSSALSCATMRYPGGANGVLLKSKLLQSSSYADFAGLIQDGLSMFSVSTATGNTLSHWFFGNVGSHLYNTDMKWFFNVCIPLSAAIVL